ncbi:MAG: hypothetical protein MJ240_10935 [Kiritimatiellae bacterium]|nr:hypothetical protein [Kiritimatiellia bacterium]
MSSSVRPELHLLILWPKARGAERRILADIPQHAEIVWKGELRFAGDPALAYRRFYGPALPDERRKLATCGAGPFLVVVVRDAAPRYEISDDSGRKPALCNLTLLGMKTRYRKWTGSGHRVHGTLSPAEFARDIRILTGHTAEEWERGIPPGPLEPILPNGWTAESTPVPFARGTSQPASKPEIKDAHVFLENKYINDRFLEGSWKGIPCVVKVSTKAIWSVGNEYKMNGALYAVAPSVVPMPLAWHFAADGKSAFVVTEKVAGPSLTELLARGLTDDEANRFAADIRTLAAALKQTGILHRDLFADNLLLGADGHLKAIDWQLAIDRNVYREDPWVRRNWKFRYVVFGVNRELGLGVWNDYHALGKIIAQFPQTEKVKSVAAELASVAPEMAFASPPKGLDRLRLWFYGCSLRLQMLIRGRKHRKYAQLERRWRTVRCDWE